MKATKFLLGFVLTLAVLVAWTHYELEGYWIIPAGFLLAIGWYLMAFNFGAVINLFKKK